MKLGYLTKFTADEPARARRLGFDCLEAYAGSWQDEHVYSSGQQRQSILDELKRARDEHGITISSFAHYGGGLRLKGQEQIDSFAKAIELADLSGAKVVSSIVARNDPNKSVSDNIPAFKEAFTPIARLAEEKGVRIAFENWPAFGGYPLAGKTMAYTPDAWDKLFDAVPSKAMGLEFDPSHLYWQGIDHIAALKKYADRVHHVHAKDTETFPERRNRVGIYGDGWWTYRIPGLGEIDWARFIGELHTIGYAGGICIEHEDQRFDPGRREATADKFEQGLKIGLACLRPLVG